MSYKTYSQANSDKWLNFSYSIMFYSHNLCSMVQTTSIVELENSTSYPHKYKISLEFQRQIIVSFLLDFPLINLPFLFSVIKK